MTGHDPTPRPSERFSGDAGVLDVRDIATELLGAADAERHGRSQRTLHRSGGVTIAMFAFRAGASLPKHAADAVVSIHVLHGEVSVTAGGRPFALREGQLLRLEPRTPHEVVAALPSVVLVHIAGSPG